MCLFVTGLMSIGQWTGPVGNDAVQWDDWTGPLVTGPISDWTGTHPMFSHS
jgi:hypothetical protein